MKPEKWLSITLILLGIVSIILGAAAIASAAFASSQAQAIEAAGLQQAFSAAYAIAVTLGIIEIILGIFSFITAGSVAMRGNRDEF